MSDAFPRLAAAEAALQIQNGQTVAFSGFTPAGASTGHSLDGSLARADAILFRTPYQNDPDLRKSINEGRTRFYDMHLSMLPQAVRYGFLGPVHWAVIEACDVTDSGEITLASSVGAAPTFCRVADKILIELNRFHPAGLHG